jgi:CDP-diacylglycerol--glycerol-3-phosphate 3-phosphatidyltransferase
VVGFLLSVVAGVVLASGNLAAGGVLVLIAGLFDTLDGALARATGQETVFGKFFDSTMDRFSEAVIFLGIAIAFMREPPLDTADIAGVALSFVVMIGSLMISYARARAEGLEPRVDCEVGWLQRPERILILGAGLLLPRSLLLLVLLVLAVLTHVTVGQRIAHVRRQTQAA